MKKLSMLLILAIIMIAGLPPPAFGAEYGSENRFTIEQSDMDITIDQVVFPEMDMTIEPIYLEGTVIIYLATSAKDISINQIAVLNQRHVKYRHDNLYSLGLLTSFAETDQSQVYHLLWGSPQLGIGESIGTWPYQETYIR